MIPNGSSGKSTGFGNGFPKKKMQWSIRRPRTAAEIDANLGLPGDPTPTDAALSVADTADEKDRLAASTDNTTEAEVPVKE